MAHAREGIDLYPDARRAIDFTQLATSTRGDQLITADLVEGVLVKYWIASK